MSNHFSDSKTVASWYEYRGFKLMSIIVLILSILTMFVLHSLFSSIKFLSDYAGILTAISTLVIIFITIHAGFAKVAAAHGAIPLFFEARIKVRGGFYSEGPVWNIPGFGFMVDSLKEKTEMYQVTEALTRDTVATTVDGSQQWRIADLYKYSQVDDPKEALHEFFKRAARIAVAYIEEATENGIKKSATQIVSTSAGIVESWIHTGIPDGVIKDARSKGLVDAEYADALSTGMKKHAANVWGIEIMSTRVTNIRLPADIEKAAAGQIKEDLEAILNKRDARTTDDMMTMYQKGPDGTSTRNISDKDAMIAAQIAQGHRKVVHVEGNGGELLKSAAILNGILGDTDNKGNDND